MHTSNKILQALITGVEMRRDDYPLCLGIILPILVLGKHHQPASAFLWSMTEGLIIVK